MYTFLVTLDWKNVLIPVEVLFFWGGGGDWTLREKESNCSMWDSPLYPTHTNDCLRVQLALPKTSSWGQSDLVWPDLVCHSQYAVDKVIWLTREHFFPHLNNMGSLVADAILGLRTMMERKSIKPSFTYRQVRRPGEAGVISWLVPTVEEGYGQQLENER